MSKLKISEIKPNPNNPRNIKREQLDKLKQSIKDFPQMFNIRPIIVDENNMVLGGNMRLKALEELGYDDVSIIKVDDLTEEQKKEFIIKDNLSYGDWDWDMLELDWDIELLQDWGLDMPIVDDTITDVKLIHNKLTETFVVPPFSILDTRQGYWVERKSYWKDLINDNGESRENLLDTGGIVSTLNNGVSILDPVLAEVVGRWFAIPNSNVFDCFAGDTIFGYVSSYLGHNFTGIELREEQAKLNNDRVKSMTAKYICDDGQNVDKHIEENSQDLLFSCPPYFDLEVYSDLPNDASNQSDYQDFIKILDNAFSKSIKCLKDNRFAVIVVGDVRDKKGFYYGFNDDVKQIFKRNGMSLYNEMVLVESIGTLPQRVGMYMKNRKIGKCHQNIFVFYKGDTSKIAEIYPKLDIIVDESTDV
jgi:hypothetical protein